MIETQHTISAWADATFGPAGCDLACVTRANLEMAELLHAVAIGEPAAVIVAEIADVAIVLCRLATRRGLDMWLEAADWERSRAWSVPDAAIQTSLALNQMALALVSPSNDLPLGKVVALLEDLAAILNVDIRGAVNAKMAINRRRQWRLDGHGHGYHVKTEESLAIGAWADADRRAGFVDQLSNESR